MLIPLRPAPMMPLVSGLWWWCAMAYTTGPSEITVGTVSLIRVFAFPPANSHLLMLN